MSFSVADKMQLVILMASVMNEKTENTVAILNMEDANNANWDNICSGLSKYARFKKSWRSDKKNSKSCTLKVAALMQGT